MENDIASAYGVFLLNLLGYEAYVLEGTGRFSSKGAGSVTDHFFGRFF